MPDIVEDAERANSRLSLFSKNSEDSLDDQVKDVTDDLKEMLQEVESLRKSQTIYETSNTDLQEMIEDVGRISKRNSDIMAEDFDIFSLSEKDFLKADQDWAKKRYSSHLMPMDASRIRTPSPVMGVRMRRAVSSEILNTKEKVYSEDDSINKNGSQLHSGHSLEMDEEMKPSNPWDGDEKVGGTTHTLKVRL